MEGRNKGGKVPLCELGGNEPEVDIAGNAQASMLIGNNQNVSANSGSGNQSSKDDIERQGELLKGVRTPYCTWIMGLVISLIPIFLYPFYELIISEIDVGEMFYKALCSSDIIFLTISLCVSSLNDAMSLRNWRYHKIWSAFTWIFIIVGAAVFGLVSVAESRHEEDLNYGVIVFLNVVLFVVSFVAGSIPYIVAISEVKRKIKEGTE